MRTGLARLMSLLTFRRSYCSIVRGNSNSVLVSVCTGWQTDVEVVFPVVVCHRTDFACSLVCLDVCDWLSAFDTVSVLWSSTVFTALITWHANHLRLSVMILHVLLIEPAFTEAALVRRVID